MRLKYQNDHKAAFDDVKPKYSGTRAKTYNLLINKAMNMLEMGWYPSIPELAIATGLSRATAYRYFPTQSDLVSSMVEESLGPIKAWVPTEETVQQRISTLLAFAYPQMEKHEGALRAALQVSLQQWAAARAQQANTEGLLIRGNRKRTLAMVTEPLKDALPDDELERLKQAFSLIYGSEIFLVLKDIWQLESEQIQDVVQWMAKAISRQAEEDAGLLVRQPVDK